MITLEELIDICNGIDILYISLRNHDDYIEKTFDLTHVKDFHEKIPSEYLKHGVRSIVFANMDKGPNVNTMCITLDDEGMNEILYNYYGELIDVLIKDLNKYRNIQDKLRH